MSLLRQMKQPSVSSAISPTAVSANQFKVIAAGGVAIFVVLLIVIALLFSKVSNSSTQPLPTLQDNTAGTQAAMTYCTTKTQGYAKDSNEFRLGVEGCMKFDDYALSLQGKTKSK